MRRLFDVIAIIVVIGFFSLGLYGAPRGEGSLYLWIALAVFAALAIGWLVAKSGEVVAGVGRDIRAARVAAAKIKLRNRLGADVEPDVEAAFAALAKRDWKAAAALMFIAAEGGDPKAQHTLSHLFAAGAGVPRSREEALKWLRRAAERHLADAQYELGVAHFTGYGGTMPRSVADGLDWLRKAADQAHDGAAVRLGEIFQRGDGVEKDEHEAASWFRRAAERGDPHGQRALGRAYRKGRGLPKDSVQAYAWLAIAARRAAARGLHEFIRESELYDAEKDVGASGR
ncbi:MAG: tetratricopeptide repeat protein, partial [Pseudomonadota bacterium]